MPISIPVGSILTFHRPGAMDLRLILESVNPDVYKDEKGNSHSDPFKPPLVGISITYPGDNHPSDYVTP
ncbi:hypothetical protein [Burkholderia gladioli]|uniref:hypothetical protein n=1 Tax=Burkholderia gladioli TaxID=28095 RepID=UPI003D22DBD5